MADYLIKLGVELDTKKVDSQINAYKAKKPIELSTKLNTSNIDKELASYKAKNPIEVGVKLNTTGIAKKIGEYKPKTPVILRAELNTADIDSAISAYAAKNKKITVGVQLNTQDINAAIQNYSATAKPNIEVNAKLNDKAIDTAIQNYKPKQRIKVALALNAADIESKIGEYEARSPLRVKVKINKTDINRQLSEYNDADAYITVKAKLDNGAISEAIRNYKATTPIKVALELDPTDINNKINVYKSQSPVEIPAKLKLNVADISAQLKKHRLVIPVKLNVAEFNIKDIEEKIRAYRVAAPIRVGLELDGKNVNEQMKKYGAQTPIRVNVQLDTKSIEEKIKSYKTKSLIKVGVKLDSQKINEQIRNVKTKSLIKVGVQLDKNDINTQIQAAKSDVPINIAVELDLESAKAKLESFRAEMQKLGNITIQLPNVNAGNVVGNKGNNVISGGNVAPTYNAVDNFNKFAASVTNAENVVTAMNNELKDLGVTLGSTQADTITQDIKKMGIEVQNVVTTINGNKLKMSITGIQETEDGLRRIVNISKEYNSEISNPENINKRFTQNFETSLDRQKQEVKEVNAAYREMKSLIGQIQSTSIDFNKVKSSGGDVGALEQKLTTLNARYDELEAKTRGKLDSSQIRNLSNAWDDLADSVDVADQKLTNAAKRKTSLDRQKQEVKEVNAAYREMKSLIREMGSTQISIGKFKETGQDCDALERKLATLNARYDELNTKFANRFDANQIRNIANEWQNVGHSADIAREAIERANAETARNIRSNGFVDYDAKVKALEISIRGLVNPTNEVEAAFKDLKLALADMQNASDDNKLIEAEKRYQKALKETEAQLSINKSMEAQYGGTGVESFAVKKEAVLLRISGLFENGSQAAKRFGGEVRKLVQELNNVGSEAGIDKVNDKVANLEKRIKQSNLQTKTWSSNLKDQFSKYTRYLSVYSLFMYAVRALRSMLEQVKAIDKAMTELKKVTDETEHSYNRFLDNAASKSKEIGTTIDGLVSSTADFARLGYGFKDAQGLAEIANIYAVVGDEVEGVEGATESLVSTMAAFKSEMNGMSDTDFAMSIIDKFNEIGNNFAISSGGIGEAMERSASSLMAANNTIDESIALITAANTVVQNPDAVGRLMPTIKVAISVKLLRRTRPSKDFVYNY